MIQFLKNTIQKHCDECSIYIFGSRVDDTKKGGDIDVLLLSKKKISFQDKVQMKLAFYNKFGEQKLDIVNILSTEKSVFKDLILLDAIKIL